MEESKTVTLSKKQFDSIMSRLDNLDNGKALKKPQRVKDHTAYLRLHEGKPVIGYGNAVDVYDKAKMRWRLDLPLILADGEVSVDYMGFLEQNNHVQVKIIKQVPKERVESAGIGPKHSVTTDKLTGEEIEMEVTYIDYEVEVEITEGELKGTVLQVPSTALNA